MPLDPYSLHKKSNEPRPALAARHALLGGALVASSLFSVTLLQLRVLVSGHITYTFLNWNLFLAWLPVAFAGAAWLLQGNARRPRLPVLPLLALWLLFLPNAPYLLTDLIHLGHRAPVPLWFDLLLLTSFAWNGLILGFVSLQIVQTLVQRWYGTAVAWLAAGGSLTLAAFGIYLGRFERWNSWDIFTNPMGVAGALLNGLANPLQYKTAIVITLLMTGLLIACYGTLSLLAAGGLPAAQASLRRDPGQSA